MSQSNPWESPVASIAAGALCVRYVKLADRLSHCIGILTNANGGSTFFPILESVEGDASEAWPASPPMQQIVQESIGRESAPVLLGVGLSGNGHWSSAVEAVSPESLKLDIACKNSKPASFLGSRYLANGEIVIDFDTNQVKVVAGPTTGGGKSVVFSIQIGRIAIDERNRFLSISPGSDPASMLTHRWCYEVAVV